MYCIELVWNREFHWVVSGHQAFETLDEAIEMATELENSGDGERVKKTRIIDDHERVVWAHGKKVPKPCERS